MAIDKQQLTRVTDASDFVSQWLDKRGEWLDQLEEQELLAGSLAPGQLKRQLAEKIQSVTTEDELHQVLRDFRNQNMLRIIWRDICQLAPLGETLEDLSALADCCIVHSLQWLYLAETKKSGYPVGEDGRKQHLMVLGMGKLGAKELNLSSDIDLIFVFPSRGKTDGDRVIDNERFFTRVGQKLINSLSKVTADGFVFRVDMRLRPFGDAGPLVITTSAAENYYHSQAREWERYAMIKARILTGEPEDQAELREVLLPFIYRRYIDFGVIDAIRDMKAKIEKEMFKKGMDENIKLGRGGIREIEFIGQAFQLVRGGRSKELQIRPILQVLAVLEHLQLLPSNAAKDLTDAYQFLRFTENRLQAWKDEQTHLLPSEDSAKQRLARAMNYPDWDAFNAQLEIHRQKVNGHFQLVFSAPQVDEAESTVNLATQIWKDELPEEAMQAMLEDLGYDNSGEAARLLLGFKQSPACRALSVRGRDRLDHLMPLLLEAISGRDNASQTLDRILKLLYSIVKRTAYLNLLLENPLALSQLVRLGGESAWIISQLSRHPLLLDDLLDPRQLYSPMDTEQLQAELSVLMDDVDPEDLEQQMERMRQFADSSRLRVAAADLADVIPLRVVSDYLTRIAETVIAKASLLLLRSMVTKHGWPNDTIGNDGSFAIVAYGKMGGAELGYSSDLDLLFLHGSTHPNAFTDGNKSIANDVFYARLGQRIINFMTTRTASGQLYEIDMRLRPNGKSGMLVSSLKAFERYQFEKAWVWEHQALVRARAVAGDPEVMLEFEQIRQKILQQRRDDAELKAEILKMRSKMRDNLDKSDSKYFDIKQGVGGITDIEFMVQYAVLRWGYRYPELLNWTGNIRLLGVMAKLEILEGNSAELLSNAYKVYRAIYHRNALKELPGLVPVDDLEEERAMVIEIWQQMLLQEK